jgi:FkbM family methyltransferase
MSSVLRIKPNLIIHVGADLGQDRPEYIKLGCKDIIWCEADPRNVAYLRDQFPEDEVISGVAWKEDLEKINFYQFSNSAQNSAIHPTSTNMRNSHGAISIQAHMLDTSLASIKAEKKTLLVIDVQGAEKEVLAGATNLLRNIDFVIIEIALKSQGYVETPSQQSINIILSEYGFKPSLSRFSHDESYKDQLFLKATRLFVFKIRIYDYFFSLLMKMRHVLKFYHLPKHHYYCSICND